MDSPARAPRWLSVVRGGGVALLIASLGVTAWLVHRPGGSRSECAEGEELPTAEAAAHPSEALSGNECGQRWVECTREMEGCRKELAGCHERIGELQESHEAFLAGDPEPELEGLTRADVARFFDSIEGLDWSFECRNAVCRAELYWGREAHEAVQAAQLAIQGDAALHRHFYGMGFRGGRSTRDAISGEQLANRVIYFDARRPEEE